MLKKSPVSFKFIFKLLLIKKKDQHLLLQAVLKNKSKLKTIDDMS